MLSHTLLQVLASSLQRMWVGRLFPKGVLTKAYSTFLRFSYTLLENTSIVMKVDVIWLVVSRQSSFLVLNIWHCSTVQHRYLKKLLSSCIRMFEVAFSIWRLGAKGWVKGISLHIPSPLANTSRILREDMSFKWFSSEKIGKVTLMLISVC